jgi:hypothetical protein
MVEVWSFVSKTRILHLQDVEGIRKAALVFFDYEKGKGTRAYASYYLDYDDIKTLADLSRHYLLFSTFTVRVFDGFRGSSGRARRLQVQVHRQNDVAKLAMRLEEGRGEQQVSGIVKMVGAPETSIACMLPQWNALSFCRATLDYFQDKRTKVPGNPEEEHQK